MDEGETSSLEESAPVDLLEDASVALGAFDGEEPAAHQPVPAEELSAGLTLESEPLEIGIEDMDALAADDGEVSHATAQATSEPAQASPPAAQGEVEAAEEEEGVEFDLDLDEVFVLDFEEEAPPASQVQPPDDLEAPTREAEAAPASLEPLEKSRPGAIHIDAEMLERTAAEVQAELAPLDDEPEPPLEDDLITEAEVLAKYGLLDRAQERLRQVLGTNPRHLGALTTRLQLHLDAGHHAKVAALAGEVFEVAAEQQADLAADRVARRLRRAGFVVEDGRVEPPAAEGDASAAAVDELLSDALGLSAAKSPPASRAGAERSLTAELDVIAASVFADPEEVLDAPSMPAAAGAADAAPEAEIEAPAESTEAPPVVAPGEVIIESFADELQAEMGGEPGITPTPTPAAEAAALVPPPAAAQSSSEPESAEARVDLDDSMSWLDDASRGPNASEMGLFSDEDDFFDLAGALEEELKAEEERDGDGLLAEPGEQSLEEIVEGFKKGVAENLSDEDYGTHFNLGIAYREMGLLDESIGEFQLASKAPIHLVECCSMLGLCFLEKGLPELAVKWYQRGLEVPGLSEEVSLGLQYDLGNAYFAKGEAEEARKVFVEVYGTNSNYRDIVAKLEELAR